MTTILPIKHIQDILGCFDFDFDDPWVALLSLWAVHDFSPKFEEKLVTWPHSFSGLFGLG